MKWLRKKILTGLLPAVLFVFVIPAGAQNQQDSLPSNISLYTYVDKEQVPQNHEIVYTVELRWRGELTRYKILEIEDPKLTNLTVRGSGSSNKVTTLEDGRLQSVKQITYYLKPVEMGMAYIDGMIIRYEDTERGESESLIAGRIGVKVEQPVIETGNGTAQTIILWFVVIVLLALVAFFLVRYKNKKAELERAALEQIIESTEEKYLRLLKETIHFSSDNLKDSITDLSHLLTGYLSERFSLPAGGLSSKDMLQILSEKEIEPDTLERLKDFYAKADLVRYAGETI